MDHDGDTAKRRRVVIAGTCVAAAVALGVGFLATAGVPGLDGHDDSVALSSGRPLDVRVESGTPSAIVALFDGQITGAAATWRAADQTVVYVSDLAYSSSCPPDATAEVTDGGAVTLDVSSSGGSCTADAGRVTVLIGGLAEAPPELTVNARGESSTIAVGPRTTIDPLTTGSFTLECRHHDGRHVGATFDFIDPQGSPTPEQAVAPLLADDESTSAPEEIHPGSVRIALLRADGTTRAVVSLQKAPTGWQLGTIDGCPEDGIRPAQD